MKEKLKHLIDLIWGLLPQPLPLGMAEFDLWTTRIIRTYGLLDNDSVRFALATMIMHVGPQSSRKSPLYFAKTAKKGMANQIAHGYMQNLKEKQALEMAAEKAKTEADKVTVNDEPKPV